MCLCGPALPIVGELPDTWLHTLRHLSLAPQTWPSTLLLPLVWGLAAPSMWPVGLKHPFNAQTVVDSWLRSLNPDTASPYAWMMGMVVKGANEYAYGEGEVGPEVVQIRAIDDYTFQMDLVGPAPYVLGMLPHNIFGVLPLHVIEQYGDIHDDLSNCA